MTDLLTDRESILATVKTMAQGAGVLGDVELAADGLQGRALGCQSKAFYRLFEDEGRVWVSFVTPDRWLSESIEADLEHTGDHLDELLEEELAEFGVEARPEYQHFRSEDRLFTFRSPIPVSPSTSGTSAAKLLFAYLMAYEACFRELGNVAGGGEDD